MGLDFLGMTCHFLWTEVDGTHVHMHAAMKSQFKDTRSDVWEHQGTPLAGAWVDLFLRVRNGSSGYRFLQREKWFERVQMIRTVREIQALLDEHSTFHRYIHFMFTEAPRTSSWSPLLLWHHRYEMIEPEDILSLVTKAMALAFPWAGSMHSILAVPWIWCLCPGKARRHFFIWSVPWFHTAGGHGACQRMPTVLRFATRCAWAASPLAWRDSKSNCRWADSQLQIASLKFFDLWMFVFVVITIQRCREEPGELDDS